MAALGAPCPLRRRGAQFHVRVVLREHRENEEKQDERAHGLPPYGKAGALSDVYGRTAIVTEAGVHRAPYTESLRTG